MAGSTLPKAQSAPQDGSGYRERWGEYERTMRRIRRTLCVRLLFLGLALGLAILWLRSR